MSEQSQKIRLPLQLTLRQQQVLRLLGAGETTKGIAGELGISPKTVEEHRANLMRRVNLWSYQQLTKLALRLGLTEIDV
jgi:DNA-binding NarL/FixJ family response regulator